MKSILFGIFLVAVISTVICGCSDQNSLFTSIASRDNQDPNGRFTILLSVLSNPNTHERDALYYQQQTEKLTGWRGLFIRNRLSHSELYWGKYASIKKARGNLKKAKAYRTPADIHVFAKAMIMPLPGEDVGPGQFDLANASGAYTVVVAIFYDVPEASYLGRKYNAADYCRQLRDQGHQAYYKHGVARSAVTIGTFPESAVEIITQDGKQRTVITDPEIQQIRKQFAYLAVNGRKEFLRQVNPQTNQVVKIPQVSYLARIHTENESTASDSFDYFGNQ